MRKAILMMVLCTAALPVLAQIDKGSFMIGGSVGGSWSKHQSNQSGALPSSDWHVLVSPNAGYFVAKGLAVGAVTSYNFGQSRASGLQVLPDGTRFNYKSLSQSFLLGPSIHYYRMLGEKLAFYAQTSLAWGRYTVRNTAPEAGIDGALSVTTRTYTSRSRAFSLGPGLAYFLNPHVALQGGVSYRNDYTRNEETEYSTGGTNSTNGVYLNVGVQVFLGR